MVSKPGKSANKFVKTSLLSTSWKFIDKQLLSNIRTDKDLSDIRPYFQFEFREHDSTAQQTQNS